MKINTLLKYNTSTSKRVGRGIGSGKGKTSGRGHKGQSSRAGVSLGGFQGGQLSLIQSKPKRGFRPYRHISYHVLNLSTLELWIKNSKISLETPITKALLVSFGIIPSIRTKLKVLGSMDSDVIFNVEYDACSKSASRFLKVLINET